MQIVIALNKVPVSDLKFMLFYLKINDDEGASTTYAIPIHFKKHEPLKNENVSL